MSIQIVKFGTPVITKIGQVKALITATCIRDQNVTYELSYFIQGQHTETWCARIEFDIDDSEKQKPGLVNYHVPEENTYTLLSE